MAKRILYPLLQFIAFLGLMFIGGNWDAINLKTEMQQMMQHQQPHVLIQTIKFSVGAHTLIANGLLYATLLLALIVAFEALRKCLKPWAALTVVTYVLAVMLAFAMKMGLPPAS